MNAVSPGFIDTEMNDRTLEQLGTTIDALVSRSPMARVSEAAEIAQSVVFLCSDAASYITGQSLSIDGGATVS